MLPQISQGGEVSMTLHQVNADGGGPYTCMINADGTGADWQDIDVTTTPPGKNSRNQVQLPPFSPFHPKSFCATDTRHQDGAATDFPLKAAIPADQQCTGTVAGQESVCLVRCQNAARAGPFGGVVPVQLANTTTATTANATTPAATRRALALSKKRSAQLLTKTVKRAGP